MQKTLKLPPNRETTVLFFESCFQLLKIKTRLFFYILMLFVLTFAFFVLNAESVQAAASLLPGFAEVEIARNMPNPTTMQFAPDGRIFVAEQGGRLRVIKNGTLLATPFLTVEVDTFNERGLSGVAFDPDFENNGYVYIYYTATTPVIHNRLSRFTANGDVAVPGSEVVLLDLPPVGSAGMHNSGAIRFGQDGKMYVAVGDNGTANNAQLMTNLFGKILRLNTDGSIPTDNPFYTTATNENRAIWALGLRNPFSFNFQPNTWRMFINDVGQATYEEINEGAPGANFGWPTTEGPVGTYTQFTGPIHYYKHQYTTGPYADCAITGGTFYNPSNPQYPSSYVGKYFFADYCARWVRFFDPATGQATTFANGIWAPVDLKVGPDGNIYYLDRGEGGLVKKIIYTASQSPNISTHPSSLTVSVGDNATFSVVASGTNPLSYQWQRNGVDINGATTSSYTISSVTLDDNATTFRVIVTNDFGNATSNEATLTVTNNQPPTGSILSPSTGTKYNAGDTINYSGNATDPEQGELTGSAFTWQVDFHHDDHFHPYIAPTTGSTDGSFITAKSGETSANTWYRIHLTVKDSEGFTHKSYRDVHPNTVEITVQTNPAGLQFKLEGQPKVTPYTFTSVVGYPRSIEAISPQPFNGKYYDFSSWSDGGAASHIVDTPSTNATYTANFTESSTPVTCDARTGLGCVKATLGSTVTWTNPAQEPLTLQPNTTYKASIWIKGNSSLKLVAQPCWSCGSQAVIKVCNATADWSECALNFSTGSTNLSNYVFMFQDGVNSPVRPSGTVYIDDAFLGTGTTNILSNPGFEDGFIGWSLPGSASTYFTSLKCDAEPIPQPPSISQHPQNVTVQEEQSATFNVVATGSGILSYQWKRNNVDINGATSSSYTIPVVSYADNGSLYKVVVSNENGSTTSNEATLTVTPSTPTNQSPTGTITKPTSDKYNAGDTIMYEGSATDPEDGTLDVSAFSWKIDFHSGTSVTNVVPQSSGQQSGTFIIANTGDSSVNAFYRIHLTVTDSEGATHASYKDLTPNTSDLTLTTNPTGLQVKLDGQSFVAPYTVTGVVGFKRTIDVVSPQTLNGTTYTFTSWSDDGAAAHEITIPPANTTLTATFSGSTTTPNDCNARTGTGCVKATLGSTVTWTNPAQEPLILEPNTNYKASIWLKGNSSVKLVVQPCWSCGAQAVIKVCNATADWSECALNFSTSSTNYDKYIFMFQDGVNSPLRPAGTVYIDDAFLGKDSSSNVLVNNGFENGFNGWTLPSNTSTYFSAEQCIETAKQAPSISQHPSNASVQTGDSASFTVVATGTAPLNYQWQRDGVDIIGANSSTYTIDSTEEGDNGAIFKVVITNSVGSSTSNEAMLTVTTPTPTNQAPTGTITQPTNNKYNAGDTISFEGTATDLEDGTLSEGAFTWKVDRHNGTTVTNILPSTTGTQNGSFTVPTTGDSSVNVFYRILLTVVDSQGATHSSFIDITPNTVLITLQTSPTGLQIKLDGQVYTSPYSFSSVVGFIRNIDVASPQTLNGSTYIFTTWSDNGSANHDIITPSTNTTYTAGFSQSVTPTPSDCNSRSGFGCARGVLGNSLSWTNIYQEPLKLQPNTEYTASVWLKGDTSLKLVVQPCWSCSKQALIKSCSANPTTWSECKITFTTGSTNLDKYILMVQDGVNSPKRPSGTVYIDDVFLGSGTANVLSNPGFEEGLTGWKNSGPNIFTSLMCSAN